MRKFLPILFLFLLPAFCFAAIPSAINEIAEIIRDIAVAGAVLMIVIGGFQWMTSAGDPGKISNAKDRIYSAILGLVIIALAQIIATLVGAK
jgi:TRAP-type C4-dicarboxylate transport system permease small subunit